MSFIGKAVSWLRDVLGLTRSIQDQFGVTVAISPTMAAAQAEWRGIVAGKAIWNNDDTPSLLLADAVSQEIASRAALGLKSEITGSARADYLNEQYVPVIDDLQNAVVAISNGGEAIYKPNLTDDGIETTLVENDAYWPIGYNAKNELIDIIFGAIYQTDKWVYRLLERHTFDSEAQTHAIIYRAFRAESSSNAFTPDSLGTPASLSDVPDWAALQDITITGIEKPLFVLVKAPISAIIEKPQRQGVPVWIKAVDMFRKADLHEARMEWEMEGGELAVFASAATLRNSNNEKGKPLYELPEGKNRLYKMLNGAPEERPIEVFNPEPRIDAYNKRMNDILRRIEFSCGLSYGIISDNEAQIQTATEFRSSKERLVTTISGMQLDVLQPALERLIESFGVLADLQGIPAGTVNTTFEWSESYAIDRREEVEERLKLLGMGVLSASEVRAYYNEIPLEQAQKEMQERGVPLEAVEDEFNE